MLIVKRSLKYQLESEMKLRGMLSDAKLAFDGIKSEHSATTN